MTDTSIIKQITDVMLEHDMVDHVCSWIVLEHDDFARTRDEILFGIVCECKLDSYVLLTLLAVKSLRYGPFSDICGLLYLNQEVGPSVPR